MTRDEQIENAARHHSIKASEDAWNRPDWEDIEWAFEVGAEWADANPHWHKCEDELPDTKMGRYICTDGRDVFIAVWCDDTPDGLSGWNLFGMYNEPTAWMKLPEPPKFDCYE